jgi:hypothetical protein
MRSALDRHNAGCARPPQAILLNPIDHGLMRWDNLWGLPVLADDRVPVKGVYIQCDGLTWDSEEELVGTAH